MSGSYVQRALRRYRESGQMEALRRGATLPPKISEVDLEVIQALIEEQNDVLLSELCERLQERIGIKVSVPTMHRAVQRLRMRHKKKRCMPVSKTLQKSSSNGTIIVVGWNG